MTQALQATEKTNIIPSGSQYDALINKALDSSEADIDKLQKLMEMKEKWEQGEAKKAYDQAMADFAKSAPTAVKSKEGYGYKYATLAQIVDLVRPELSKYGLAHSWKTRQDGQTITVDCVISHSQGHSETVSLSSSPDTSGGKNAIQAIGSTVSYLERYTFQAATGIASKDMDDDGQTANKTPEVQENPLHSLMMMNDSLGVYLLQKGMEPEDQAHLHWWPSDLKLKGKLKERAEQMRQNGESLYQCITESINNQDAYQLSECIELAVPYTRALLARDLGEAAMNTAKELFTQVAE